MPFLIAVLFLGNDRCVHILTDLVKTVLAKDRLATEPLALSKIGEADRLAAH